MPWREEYEEHFVPMIGGRSVEWNRCISTAWTSNIIFHRLHYPITEPGEWVLDEIPHTPGADHPVWKIPTWLWIDNEQKYRAAAARSRYKAEAGTNTALPSRGFVRWSPTGSLTHEDIAPTVAALDTYECEQMAADVAT